MQSCPPSVIHRLAGDRCGASAVEYTLIVALISVAAVAMMTTVGQKVGGVLNTAANAMP